VIRAYCKYCGREIDHAIYVKREGFFEVKSNIYIKCLGCGKEIYAGNGALLGFERIYCVECGRETLWALYCDDNGDTYFVCIGCGLRRYVGNGCEL
jgi:DNA-directed RNA polymerase subunit RPC12/RpoP/ribosomal protein L24E